MELKNALNLIQNLSFNFNIWPKTLNQFSLVIKKSKCMYQIKMLNVKYQNELQVMNYI
jgi:hypothetical protein